MAYQGYWIANGLDWDYVDRDRFDRRHKSLGAANWDWGLLGQIKLDLETGRYLCYINSRVGLTGLHRTGDKKGYKDLTKAKKWVELICG